MKDCLLIALPDYAAALEIRHFVADPALDPAIFVSDLQHDDFFTRFYIYYFLKLHFRNFSKKKVIKKSQNRRNDGFSYYFRLIEGSGARYIRYLVQIKSGSGEKSNGSGSPTRYTVN